MRRPNVAVGLEQIFAAFAKRFVVEAEQGGESRASGRAEAENRLVDRLAGGVRQRAPAPLAAFEGEARPVRAHDGRLDRDLVGAENLAARAALRHAVEKVRNGFEAGAFAGLIGAEDEGEAGRGREIENRLFCAAVIFERQRFKAHRRRPFR